LLILRYSWLQPKANATGQLLEGLNWRITYADGSGAAGVVYADDATIGGVAVASQAVQTATSVSPAFSTETGHGIRGLGFSNMNTVRPTKQKTWFENVKSCLAKPLFTANLKKMATGSFDFGFVDGQKYVEPLRYAPVNTLRGYWEFIVTGY
jgi:hypothetical protein